MNIKDKITEEVSSATKEIVKETAEEVLKQSNILPPVLPDKEMIDTTKDILDETKEFINKNRKRLRFITQKLVENVLKSINRAKDVVAEQYIDSVDKKKVGRINLHEHSKLVIIDASTGKEKYRENLTHSENLITKMNRDFDEFDRMCIDNPVAKSFKIKNIL